MKPTIYAGMVLAAFLSAMPPALPQAQPGGASVSISPTPDSAVEGHAVPSTPPTSGYAVGKEMGVGALGKLGERKVDLSANHADPWEAILNLLRSSGVNYVIGGEATGGRKITANFKQVPLADALDALASAAGLAYTAKGDIILLIGATPPEVVSLKTFPDNNWNQGTAPATLVPLEGNTPPSPSVKTLPGSPDNFPNPAPVSPANNSDSQGGLFTIRRASDPTTLLPPLAQGDRAMSLEVSDPGKAIQFIEKGPKKFIPGLSNLIFDQQSNQLAASGTQESLNSLRAVVEKWNAPPRGVLMKFFVFTHAKDVSLDWTKDEQPSHASSFDAIQWAVIPNKQPVDYLIKQIESQGGKLVASPVVTTLSDRSITLDLAASEKLSDKDSSPYRLLVVPQVDYYGTFQLNVLAATLKNPAVKWEPLDKNTMEAFNAGGYHFGEFTLRTIDGYKPLFSAKQMNAEDTLALIGATGNESGARDGKFLLLMQPSYRPAERPTPNPNSQPTLSVIEQQNRSISVPLSK